MSTASPPASPAAGMDAGVQDVAIVIPTIGRPSLAALLASIAASAGPLPIQLIIVDDRAVPEGPLRTGPVSGRGGGVLRIVHSGGLGPAGARNVGWRAASARWIAFLDDDVIVGAEWLARLATDIELAHAGVAGISGRVRVPLPTDRRPTDWERGTAALADAQWITADMAYRSEALHLVGGFDERFRRAFREDSDIALRMLEAGYEIAQGQRSVAHPVRPAPWHASIGQQRGNADDVLMRRLHGRDWARGAGASPGRRKQHVGVTAAALTALCAAAIRQRRLATFAGLIWLAGTAEFAWARIAPGPRSADEVARMLVTSLVIPPAAVGHWLAGLVRHRNEHPRTVTTRPEKPATPEFRAPEHTAMVPL